MLDFSDLPYLFVPPKPNGVVIALTRVYNRVRGMRGPNHLLRGIDLGGLGEFRAARRQSGARFVLVPNHPTHSDPYAVVEICRRAGVKPAFMTAYDVFARSRFNAWVMQRTGAFSVDREGSDRKSMKCAGEILAAGRQPLVIFPEGNVYLHNDRVSAFNEGAAYIALRAQKEIGTGSPVYAVPVSLKYTFIEDVREHVRGTLDEVAGMFGMEFDRSAPIAGEIVRISATALGRYLKNHGYAPSGQDADTETMIAEGARQIIASLESKLGLSATNADDLFGRVRKVRAAIHSVRTDPTREVDQRAAAHWADEAILALRILGYSRGYAAGKPTVDRIAETVERLHEDVTSKLHPPAGRRRVLAEIGTPIDLRDHLGAFAGKARAAIEEVTSRCEAACQAGIDRLNSKNTHPGAEEF